MEENINNLNEIIELCEEEINNNNENVTAILDLADLKSLRNLITRLKEKINLKQLKIKDLAAENDYLKALLYCKDKQIDLMAEEINETDRGYNDYCKHKIVCDRNCKTCIKKYFEKKVEK